MLKVDRCGTLSSVISSCTIAEATTSSRDWPKAESNQYL